MCTMTDKPSRRHVKEPEYRALEQIVADAEAAGVPILVLGPSGILEIQPPWPPQVVVGSTTMEMGELPHKKQS
jgi:hypothetical protein